jgi:hypothetical protein
MNIDAYVAQHPTHHHWCTGYVPPSALNGTYFGSTFSSQEEAVADIVALCIRHRCDHYVLVINGQQQLVEVELSYGPDPF